VHADIILLAVIAAVILLWLRSVVGTRSDSDRQRPNPYKKQPQSDKAQASKAQARKKAGEDDEDKRAAARQRLKGPETHPDIDNKTAEAGLTQIALADKSFDTDAFLQGAKAAFKMIVPAFASGDREVLESLLAEDVYKAFDAVITERESNDQTAQTTIHAIEKAKIIDAKLKDNVARITVRFTARETHVTRDSEGRVVYGHPSQKNNFTDVWVFARDTKSSDLKWLLVETRDDEEEETDKTPMPEASDKKSAPN
tara:strand:+ start:96 stop:860 length:765 start_codon:yes stop_codon:yes gene_type:complete